MSHIITLHYHSAVQGKARLVSSMAAEKVVQDLHSIEDMCLDHNKTVCALQKY